MNPLVGFLEIRTRIGCGLIHYGNGQNSYMRPCVYGLVHVQVRSRQMILSLKRRRTLILGQNKLMPTYSVFQFGQQKQIPMIINFLDVITVL